MIVAFIINKAWFVIIFQYLSIGGVDNMATIKGEDAAVSDQGLELGAKGDRVCGI